MALKSKLEKGLYVVTVDFKAPGLKDLSLLYFL